MADDIRLLEQLVAEAVDRLKRLAAERDSLADEVRTLRSRANGSGEAGDVAREASRWQLQREQVITELRETLAELRGD